MSEEFNKKVADTFREIKGDFERSLEPPPPDGCGTGGGRHRLDKAVVEQVRADLDGVIKRHDPSHDPAGHRAPEFKPAFFGAEGQWDCPNCGVANHEMRGSCRNCGVRRAADER